MRDESKLTGTTIADRLKATLDYAGLNSAELANRIGISRSAMSYLLNGKSKTPKANNLLAIEDATGVSARWIESGEGPPTSPRYAISHKRAELLAACEPLSEYELDQAIRLVKALHPNGKD